MLIFSLFFLANFIIIVLSTTENCQHPTNASEFCIKTDYDVNKLPPEKPLNVDMDLWIHVSNKEPSTSNVSYFPGFYPPLSPCCLRCLSLALWPSAQEPCYS